MDLIGSPHTRKAMSYDQHCSSYHQTIKCFLDDVLVLGVDCRKCFIEDQYRRMRAAWAKSPPPSVKALLGRVPSDEDQPRAFHEMILAGPEPLVASLREELREQTELLSRLLSGKDPFEDIF